ncbi:dynamin family protein, partial [Paenibacillus sp. GCM10023250]|uniref:dynamin family protein n=1 Tax=Paenibacillus sp. GCM10023250 TaxID=3252648 RepID=UPI00362118E4
MSHTMEKTAIAMETTLGHMAPLMAEAGDEGDAKRLLELRSKLDDGRLTIAFCGHFSAGKSTLVNRICGTELLPSSPIPTSANVVRILNGEAKATIRKLVGGQETTLDVPIQDVNEYCKDGETVVSVSLSYPIPRLGGHTVLLDTPGIDSTDDAHRMATESALHLADVVFYVMDYNHVQSEINFTFAKQLKEWGKPLYLIVNQIDKHRESELTFDAYRQSVDEAFGNWHLEPSGIVYLSLREPNHPHSEWTSLLALFESLAGLRGPLNVCSVDASARHVVRLHGKAMEEAAEAERERLLAQAGGEAEAERVRAEIAELEARLRSIEDEANGLRTRLRLDVQSLLDNANIMPAATRDLAQSFLESRKPGFKAGLLFAGAKTAAEQERRLQAFYHDFHGLVQAGIEWHLLDLFRRAADGIGWRGEGLEAALASFVNGLWDADLLVTHVNAGATFGSAYTMTYTREIADAVKGIYRKRALAWIDALGDRAAAAGEASAAPLRARLAALGAQAGALAE